VSGEPSEPAVGSPPPGILRRLRSDPDHAPERLVLFAVDRLGDQAWQFAQRAPRADARVTAAEVHHQTVGTTRIDGAISGSPFLIAFVPAYVAMLWEQARMALRMAALHGRDTRDRDVAAELLWLRGGHGSLDAARAAIAVAETGGRGQRGEGRGLRGWVVLGRRLLVVAGFLPPPDPAAATPPRWRRGLSVAIGGALYAVTWIFPITFMLAMAFSCVNSTNDLASRVSAHYGAGAAPDSLPPSGAPVAVGTRVLRALALALSIGVPLAALAVSAHSRPAGIEWYYVLAALLGLSLVIGLSARASRR
jgi:hypothetical protein